STLTPRLQSWRAAAVRSAAEQRGELTPFIKKLVGHEAVATGLSLTKKKARPDVLKGGGPAFPGARLPISLAIEGWTCRTASPSHMSPSKQERHPASAPRSHQLLYCRILPARHWSDSSIHLAWRHA